jgi:hypothetical protein
VEYKPGKQNATADAMYCRGEQEVRANAISRPEFELFDDFRRESDTLLDILAKRQEIAEGMAGVA